ncbi:rhodanese-like domain-containing protein [Robiginitalea sp.]|uniref:rhodanese-like domain-containing protein n=2 Tax=Robiginitalea sp. TaxID=1902411 RepID=UPI003C74FBC4
MKIFIGLAFCLIITPHLNAQEDSQQKQIQKTNDMELPKGKQTAVGLYVTSKEAYKMWKANPDKIKILDVRTLDEYINIGHAEMARNIPAFLQTYNWDADKKSFSYQMNPDFAEQAQKVFNQQDTILVTCRSGGRSALAINFLASLGYKNLYNITDGFEGDAETNPESKDFGKRVLNGWKNAGVPWTYDLNRELISVPKN